jgi:hypothetical protein
VPAVFGASLQQVLETIAKESGAKFEDRLATMSRRCSARAHLRSVLVDGMKIVFALGGGH